MKKTSKQRLRLDREIVKSLTVALPRVELHNVRGGDKEPVAIIGWPTFLSCISECPHC